MAITLIGFRGSGKSSVGDQLAARLGCQFVDADQEIQRRAGQTIADIFAEWGEPTFRAMERLTLSELLNSDQIVVAAGGGAVLDATTREQMRSSGPVIWLQGNVETLLERIQGDAQSLSTRPRLTSHEALEQEVRELLTQREPLYADVASFKIVTDSRSVTAIVDEILSHLPEHFAEERRW